MILKGAQKAPFFGALRPYSCDTFSKNILFHSVTATLTRI